LCLTCVSNTYSAGIIKKQNYLGEYEIDIPINSSYYRMM
jgi:hypothetical protein